MKGRLQLRDAELNELFGWKKGTHFRDPEWLEKQIETLRDDLEALELELRESKAWHSQRTVYEAIANHVTGKPLTEDQDLELKFGWVKDEA